MKKVRLSASALSTDAGILLLRLLAGGAMLTHGIPKLQKVLEGNFQFGDPIGLGPEVSLVLVVFAEFACSLLLLLGLATRFALVPLFIAMAVAAFIVEAEAAFNAKELPLIYLGIYAALFFTGPGKYSLDAQIGNRLMLSPKVG